MRKVFSLARAFLTALEPRRRVRSATNDAIESIVVDARATTDPPSALPNGAHAHPINGEALKAAAKTIRDELTQRVVSSTCSQITALDQVLTLVFGEQRTVDERLRFLAFAAPLARRLVLDRADKEQRVLDPDVTIADVCELFDWCDFFDPLGARIIDLHYFAGVSARQTARVLRMHPTAIVRELRVAKAWVRIKLDKQE